MGIVVWDLDSTIADTSPRHHLSPFVDSSQTWHSYAKACTKDNPMYGSILLVQMSYQLHNVHILTGRRSSAQIETENWLKRHDVPYDILRMRTDEDLESNTDYKIEYMRSLYTTPILFISDWLPECRAVEKHIGIPTVCVNPGYEGVVDPTMAQWMDNTPSDLEKT